MRFRLHLFCVFLSLDFVSRKSSNIPNPLYLITVCNLYDTGQSLQQYISMLWFATNAEKLQTANFLFLKPWPLKYGKISKISGENQNLPIHSIPEYTVRKYRKNALPYEDLVWVTVLYMQIYYRTDCIYDRTVYIVYHRKSILFSWA